VAGTDVEGSGETGATRAGGHWGSAAATVGITLASRRLRSEWTAPVLTMGCRDGLGADAAGGSDTATATTNDGDGAEGTASGTSSITTDATEPRRRVERGGRGGGGVLLTVGAVEGAGGATASLGSGGGVGDCQFAAPTTDWRRDEGVGEETVVERVRCLGDAIALGTVIGTPPVCLSRATNASKRCCCCVGDVGRTGVPIRIPLGLGSAGYAPGEAGGV